MPINKDLRQEISKRLLRGHRAEISRKAGVSRTLVTSWFNGTTVNYGVEAAAIEVFETVIKQEKESNKRLRAILSE